jgi:hypothetical protein
MAALLDAAKQPPGAVRGTPEDPEVAFQLWLSSPGTSSPPLFGSGALAMHAAPQVGCYAPDDVCAALPLALVSLPARAAAGLPLAAALLRGAAAAGALPRAGAAATDVFLQVHGALAARPCGRLRCAGAAREFQLFAQPWLFAPDAVGDGRHALSARVLLGIADAAGVAPAHAEPGGGGAPFGGLAPRPCMIHDGRFSPCTAALALAPAAAPAGAPGADTAAFVSVLVDAPLARAAVTLHVLPTSEAAADRARGWLRGCATLRDLLRALQTHVPHAHALAARMVAAAAQSPADAGAGAGAEAAEALPPELQVVA